jgi:hypothetical protein
MTLVSSIFVSSEAERFVIHDSNQANSPTSTRELITLDTSTMRPRYVQRWIGKLIPVALHIVNSDAVPSTQGIWIFARDF